MTPNDSELIRKAALGDRDAFRVLFDRFQREILNLAHRFGARHDVAEEVVQDTFLRLFRNLKAYDPSRPLKPWIYTIAANVCRSRIAREPRRREAPGTDRLLDEEGPGKTPPERAQDAEVGEAVRCAVAALPEEQRIVFVLARYQGLPYEEVSEVLEIPVGTVKSRMYRAIRALRQELKEHLP